MIIINLRNIIISTLLTFLLHYSLHAQTVDFIFLMDVSGSMEFSLDGAKTNAGSPAIGGDPVPAGQTSWERIYYVKNSLPIIGVLIDRILAPPFGPVSDKNYAIAIFPGSGYPASPEPILLKDSGESSSILRAWSRPYFENIVSNQLTTRWNGTPIKRALHLAVNQWSSTPSTNKKIIFLLTDGRERDDAAPGIPDLTGIDGAAIQMGTGSETNLGFLQGIFGSSNVRDFILHLEGDPAETLTKNFVKSFFQIALYPEFTDPTFIMTNDSVKTFDVEITEYDKQLYFIASWHEPKDSSKITFTVQSPNDTLTPQRATELNDVSYIEGSTFTMYVIDPGYLQDNVGIWHGKIDGSTLNSKSKQITDYIVGGPSELYCRPHVNTSPGLTFTGNSLTYTFQTFIDELILKNLHMQLELKRPIISLGNWYAMHKLEPFELDSVRNLKFPGFVSETFKKNYYLKNFRSIDLPVYALDTLKLEDDGQNNDKEPGDGVYGVVLEKVSQPGTYQSRLLVNGQTPEGQKFTREFTQIHVVEPQIEGTWGFSQLNIRHVEQSNGFRTFETIFTPKDSFGNYLMPGQGEFINIHVSGQYE